ncbi:unnamed protein product [Dibothriocephalus latus]|uniref:Fibronectin type-III domain-containing protein n=1 Tax=Dibothriocephalus latus TaxID=60516 RepID=A0A3P7LTT0_DIBLA|nr:unnamed protein product [Dibothriocephalus latus]
MAITVGVFFHGVLLLLFVVGSHAADQQVTSIQFPHIGTDNIMVTWRAPKQPQGEITSYHVRATNRDTKEQVKSETTSTETTFSNLTPWTWYNISLATETMQLNGSSRVGEALMKEVLTLPLAGQQVTDIKFHHIGTDSITVSWTAPEPPHGEIKSYHVTARKLLTKELVKTETTTNGTTLRNLIPNTWYTIYFQTENMQLNGHGGGVGEAVVKTLPTEPLGKF